MKKSTAVIALLGWLSLPAIFPILKAGFFPMHDDTQVARVQQMHQALLAGQFPVRWVADLGYGYGYPIFNFYNPLPYYFGAVMMFLGFDALMATKLMFIFPVILSALTMCLFARILLPRWGSVLASMLYLYAPYHAVQIYVRGAVAEYWAYALLPLAFWAIFKRKVLVGGVIMAAIILSHNLTSFMLAPYLLLQVTITILHLFKRMKWRQLLIISTQLSLFVVMALSLSAFFWLPAAMEASKTRVAQMVFGEFDPPAIHAVRWRQLWWSPWGFGGSSAGIDDGFSMQLGKLQIIGSLAATVTLLACYLVSWINRKSKLAERFGVSTIYQDSSITILIILGLALSLFMILPVSTPIWNSIPILSYIQFPWRYLAFASLFASLLTAWVISAGLSYTPRRVGVGVWLGLLAIYIFSSLKFFRPQFTYPATADQLISRDNLIWDISRRSDEYLPSGFVRPVILEEARRIDNPQNAALVNQLKVDTPIRRAGNLISLVALLVLLALLSVRFLKDRRVAVFK